MLCIICMHYNTATFTSRIIMNETGMCNATKLDSLRKLNTYNMYNCTIQLNNLGKPILNR